jgi:hypothetical protein
MNKANEAFQDLLNNLDILLEGGLNIKDSIRMRFIISIVGEIQGYMEYLTPADISEIFFHLSKSILEINK